MFSKKLQEIQKIISEVVTVVKFTKNVMTKMAFHTYKNVWTQCYQNTHSSLKLICLDAKGTKYTLYKTKIYLYIRVPIKRCWPIMFTLRDNDVVKTESENRHS